MPKLVLSVLAVLLTAIGTGKSLAGPKVAVSIKPIHSLVAGVMGETGKPALILSGAAGPHGTSLKPSQAQALQKADIVFWVGDELETFMAKAVRTISANATNIPLIRTNGLETLAARETTKDHTEEEDGQHKHEDDHNGHEDSHHEDEGDNAHEHAHHAGGIDPHVWLDPVNGVLLVGEIERTLSKEYPQNAERYRSNAQLTINRILAMHSEITKLLAGTEEATYIVFHDGYHYFEKRFGLKQPVVITFNPEIAPGAGRSRELIHTIEEQGIKCLLAEPQTSASLVPLFADQADIRIGQADPAGLTIDPGPDHYFETIRALAKTLNSCLRGA